MKANYKLWIEDGEKFYGEGPHALLSNIDKLGSLNEAAKEIGLSYSKAFKIIQRAEQYLGFALLERTIGGQHGGGSSLTKSARQWMNHYQNYCFKVASANECAWLEFCQEQLNDALIKPILQRRQTTNTIIVSIVGGGGKTTMMNYLWQSLKDKYDVLFTTTTKMKKPDNITCYFKSPPFHQSVAYFKEQLTHNKVIGVMPKELERFKLTNAYDFILCEADGSKNMPFKVYASHEPPLAQNSDIVIILMGCDAFKIPAIKGVHRAEQLDIKLDQPLDFGLAMNYFKSHYLTFIPQSAKIFLVFNKYETHNIPVTKNRIKKLFSDCQREITVLITELKKECCYYQFEV